MRAEDRRPVARPVAAPVAVAVCPVGEDLVIEIGPGRGALTEKLLRRAARVVAIEIDAALVDHLRTRFAGEPRLEIVHADVLATDLAQWGRAPIAGNLPYYITSPILLKLAASYASLDLAACRDPWTCPHGRPILLTFSHEELEKRFGRLG